MRTIQTIIGSLLLAGLSCAAWAAPVNINTADAETLAQAISGVGLKKAEAIIAYREQHGAFASIDDLAMVKGIGERTVELNRDNVTVVDQPPVNPPLPAR
ncbi:MAG: hypothetical protein AMJ69_00865 [Gammaproteobacteria bacterium SG8_47]|nr:MAG: hypothetical protein AMJ69_00865 [Gammaproteobacteria bacterium SG8_47]